MHRRLVVAAMATLLSVSFVNTLHAAPFNPFHHSAADKSNARMISFNVRNDGKSTLVLKAGEQQTSIEPGKAASMKVAEGEQIINVNGSSQSAAGSVVTTVSRTLQGNTLAIS